MKTGLYRGRDAFCQQLAGDRGSDVGPPRVDAQDGSTFDQFHFPSIGTDPLHAPGTLSSPRSSGPCSAGSMGLACVAVGTMAWATPWNCIELSERLERPPDGQGRRRYPDHQASCWIEWRRATI